METSMDILKSIISRMLSTKNICFGKNKLDTIAQNLPTTLILSLRHQDKAKPFAYVSFELKIIQLEITDT